MQELLPLAPRPGRYVGIEEGAVCPEANEGRDALRCALAFPDLYEVGMSYLGQKILYAALNSLPGVRAERVFAPCRETADLLRRHKTPLATLESDLPLASLDCIGFSITHELCYTNVLYMLDLAGIPLRAAARLQGSWPLVVAGGGCTLSAEPLAPFVDVMVLGEGEETFPELLDVLRRARDAGRSRTELLEELSGIQGVYVPSMFTETADGRLESATGQIPRRRVVADLDTVPYPARQVVPLGAVHNRLSLEIARGCTRGCRFCQAGMIYRPSRERSLGALHQVLDDYLRDTGFDEVSFLSLSTGDFSALRTLFLETVERCAAEQVSVALPSLRVGSIDSAIMSGMAGIRRTGATLAPEAGSQRLRDAINKGITEESLMRHLQRLAQHGWQQVKLYFMLGLPGETDEDVLAIADLARKSRDAARGLNLPRLQITVAVSPFVPKAHTPFQWDGQISQEEIRRRVGLLREALRGEKCIKMRWHEPAMSFLEGLLSRGDRKLANVVERAYRKGAVFSSWIEGFTLEPWLEALDEEGLRAGDYTGPRDPERPLPWDHLASGLDRQFLLRERERASQGTLSPDCRYATCQGCGVCDTASGPAGVAGGGPDRRVGIRLNFPERDQREDETPGIQPVSDQQPERNSGRSKPAGTAPELAVKAVRYRVWHTKTNKAAYISQLELQPLLERAMRRAALPLAFSQGFHPLPLISFGRALPVGVESGCEWFSVTLRETLSAGEVLRRLEPCMLPGLHLIRAEAIPVNAKTTPAQRERFSVGLRNGTTGELVRLRFVWQQFATEESVITVFETKKGPRQRNIRALLAGLDSHDAGLNLDMDWSEAYLSPLAFVRAVLDWGAMPLGPERLLIRKQEQFLA